MQASTGPFATAIAGASQTVDHKVTILLPVAAAAYDDVSLVVESISVDRQLTTDMPDGTRLITGYPAASATITLSGLVDRTPGASKTVAWLLNPSEPTSPLYRSDALGSIVTVQAGLFPGGVATAELFTVFTGTVDDYTVDMLAGTVTLTCLDYRSKLNSSAMLPSFAGDDSVFAGTSFIYPGLTALWPLDYLIRANGVYAGPPQRIGCIFYMSGHGSLWPEKGVINSSTALYGTFDGTRPFPPEWVPGKFAGQAPATCNVGVAASAPLSTGSSIVFEGWVETFAVADTNIAYSIVQNGVNDSESAVEIYMDSDSTGHIRVGLVAIRRSGGAFVTGGPTAYSATGTGWHQVTVRAEFTGATTATFTVWLDGVAQTAINLTGLSAFSNDGTFVTLNAANPVDSWQVAVNETIPLPTVFTPTAVLEASLNTLTAMPDVTGQDTWSVIQQIAQAEGAIAGFDELGIFQFTNRTTLQEQVDQRTITPTYSLKTLDQEMGLSFVRNHIQVPVNKLQVQPPSTVWAAADAIEILPNSTYTQVITTDNPVVNVDTSGSVMPSGGGTPGLTYFRACTNPNGNGGERTLLTVTVTQLGPATLLLSVTSPYTYPVWLVSPATGAYPASADGQPRMWIGGSFVVASSGSTDNAAGGATPAAVIADAQWPPASEGGATLNPRGERLLVVTSNLFLQQVDSGQPFADDLLIDLYKPRPLWRNTQIVPDPRLQLGDRVAVIDPVTTMIDDSAMIVGVHISITRTDWGQTLDLRSIGTPGGWILGVAGRSNLGVSTYV